MNIIQATNLVTKFGNKIVHNGLNFSINQGEIYGLLGGSGSGKTTLLREMILLQKPTSGNLKILGENVEYIDYEKSMKLKKNWGVLFQFGALFSSLNIIENIMVALIEYTKLSKNSIMELAMMKLKMVGLSENVAYLQPSELSGGMKKRAALARALAMDPKLLFLDEPTSGLDPTSARAFDELILKLRSFLGLTVVLVTHDKESMANILDKFLIIENTKIGFEGDFYKLKEENPILFKKFME